jgi:hypothetical protein
MGQRSGSFATEEAQLTAIGTIVVAEYDSFVVLPVLRRDEFCQFRRTGRQSHDKPATVPAARRSVKIQLGRVKALRLARGLAQQFKGVAAEDVGSLGVAHPSSGQQVR